MFHVFSYLFLEKQLCVYLRRSQKGTVLLTLTLKSSSSYLNSFGAKVCLVWNVILFMEALCSCSLLTVSSLGDAFVSEAAFTLETQGAVQLLLQHHISYCAGVLFSLLNLKWEEICPPSGHRWNFHRCLFQRLYELMGVLKNYKPAPLPPTPNSAILTWTLALAWDKPRPISLFSSCVLATACAKCSFKRGAEQCSKGHCLNEGWVSEVL